MTSVLRKFTSLSAIILALIITGCSSNNTVAPSESRQHRQNMDETNYANSYDEKSIVNAASDFLGGGSEAIAKVVEKAFKDHGQPNGYIIGTEVSAALVVGVRYGDGTLSHKIEGDSRVYWKGPSIGFDAGANGSRVFALVYNLHDVEELYQRYPAVEGSFYFVGGVGMNYQQRGDIIIAPMRVGVGLRAGVNLGYLHLSKKRDWIPF
ncbi:DUF1134 domain-containing protein [Paremcibacter congregatus]|uniref:DUF1134 domain-containing protein n=1 Tax=Paremcibacter congregatus TaxID=2043170 RepID=A0A2G4YU27_9PROT|nr:DUF1134 domain-containing protein [Paremcibacter congregatus]PHZ85839.1 hypothetical protein CRD36_03940 [Paremcibacter congregatus]QDE26802.1 DUF1134 domain-containing protein [Paremcibacter congregatus]